MVLIISPPIYAETVDKVMSVSPQENKENRPFVLGLPTGSSPLGVYKKLIERTNLKTIVPYTTRPQRTGEINGKDYYSFPIPMEADYFNDEKMQELVDTIGVHLERDYRFTKEQLDDFNNVKVQDILWELVESVALDMGMVYCEDKE